MGLDIVELVMQVESVFGIEIPDADASKLRTVGDLYDYLVRAVAPEVASPDGGPYDGELWERYLDVVEAESGVVRSRLQPNASFTGDLRMD